MVVSSDPFPLHSFRRPKFFESSFRISSKSPTTGAAKWGLSKEARFLNNKKRPDLFTFWKSISSSFFSSEQPFLQTLIRFMLLISKEDESVFLFIRKTFETSFQWTVSIIFFAHSTWPSKERTWVQRKNHGENRRDAIINLEKRLEMFSVAEAEFEEFSRFEQRTRREQKLMIAKEEIIIKMIIKTVWWCIIITSFRSIVLLLFKSSTKLHSNSNSAKVNQSFLHSFPLTTKFSANFRRREMQITWFVNLRLPRHHKWKQTNMKLAKLFYIAVDERR